MPWHFDVASTSTRIKYASAVSVLSTSEKLAAPGINPLVRLASTLWLIPQREYLKRFRLGRLSLERVEGQDILVLPEVFNPVIFRTGAYFACVLRASDLSGVIGESESSPRALDLGTGTGVLAITVANDGFMVDAVDLNSHAVRCAKLNISLNSLEAKVRIHHGDLFEPVSESKFDLITFSPPSFRGEPESEFDLCWRSSDVFERFAGSLGEALKANGLALVLQTSQGDEAGLLDALLATGMRVDLFARKHFGVEIFSIYSIRH